MNVKSIVAFVSAALALAACTPTKVVQDQLVQKIDATNAECTGRLSDFTQFQFGVAFVDCGAKSYIFTSWADTHVDPYAICVFTLSRSTNHKGTGKILCNNDTAGDLTYDRTDVKNVKVRAMLNNDRRMEFTLHEDRDYPNQPLPPDTAAP